MVLQKTVAQKCQKSSFIFNKTFCCGEESEGSGAHIPKRAAKARGKHILGYLFSHIPNGPYIVQTVYFQETRVY